MKNNYGAVVLAAGYSSRMGSFKPLLPVGEMTAVERSVSSAKGAGISDIAVVTGYNRQLLDPVLEGIVSNDGDEGRINLIKAYNEEFDKGMFSSIKAGIVAIKETVPETEGVFLMPVDCPLISKAVLSVLMRNIEKEGIADDELHPEYFYVPVFEGKKGHPLFIPKKYFDEICDYDGPGGLKGITDKYWDKMVRVPVKEEGCILDMDTPEGYEEIKRFLEAGCKRTPLQELAKGRRIYLVRHGQTRQHDEKMFIGRYDVPLADDAGDDINMMAEELAEDLEKNGGLRPGMRIYTSPLIRAKQTAGIIKNVLGGEKIELCISEDLQEISLGTWDGRAVRKVREEYPEEYARRGRDIFTFKIGNKAENFYDVQYRTVRALRKILEEDDSRNIVIVSHSAVIRALENNLKDDRVDDPWESLAKGGYRKIEM